MSGEGATDLGDAPRPLGAQPRRAGPFDVDRVVVEEEHALGAAAEDVQRVLEDLAVGLHEAELVGQEAVIEEGVHAFFRGVSIGV